MPEDLLKLRKRMRDVARFFPRFVIEHILEPIEFEEDEGAAFEGRTRESVPLHENVNAILKSFRQECGALEERLRAAGRDDLASEARRAAGLARDTAPGSRVGEVREMLDGAASVLETAAGRLS
ncbi:MAG: hypothetical protein QXO51_05865 [Halobacteria archaeon]